MNCPACQTPNRDIARFCHACGLWLLPRCPFCNAEIPPSAFCDQCGRRISESASQRVGEPASQQFSNQQLPITKYPLQNTQYPISNIQSLIPDDFAAKLHAAREARAMEGERRVVTMLFCDVKGSTEAASRLDPEEWAGIINGAFECMIAPVYHYEGTVARLMGDGILAFFGAPIAHEDDPQRAILAALEILEDINRYKDGVFEQWAVEIDARIGINTGLVVVGAVGSDLQVEYSALGDAINIAARMEQTAMPGTVQISEETHKLTAPLFEFEDLGFVQVKGKAESVHTYRPLRPKARTGTSGPGRLRGIEGLESPTIGREKEISTLQTAIENLAQHGVGSLIFLTGEAGIGKSRLIRELRMKAEGGGMKEDLHSSSFIPHPSSFPIWYEIAPLSFEASQPYALFRSFLQQLTGVGEMDSVEEAHPKLAALAERLPVEVRAGVTGAFASVLGVLDDRDEPPANGESFKRQLFATAREAVHVLFAGVPGVIILDDLHWADPASLEIFNHLFPLVESVPILFLCATRPERETPTWQLKTTLAEEFPHRFVEIPVQPLTTNDSNALVDHLLTVAELPPRIRTLILNKSEGNPFFLEEIIRTLIDDGALVREEDSSNGHRHWHVIEDEVSTIIIPDNLQTLLAARLDRLTDETRRVLQMASVIGRTFYYRVLKNITETINELDGPLSTLQRMNMVVEAARLPELEYAFRHALLQETAYRSILRKQRKYFHRRVGEAIENLFATRVDEYAPVLAMHFERAEDASKTLRYYRLAGDVAFRLYATTEAIGYYGKAIEILKRNPGLSSLVQGEAGGLQHLYIRKGRALEMSGRYDDALACYLEMEILAQERGDRPLELAALVARATVHAAPTGILDRSQVDKLSQQALTLAEELEDYAAQAKIYWNLMLSGFFNENTRLAGEAGEKSLAIAREHNLHEQLAYTLNDIMRVYMMAGRIQDGIAAIEESQSLWRNLGNKNMLADNLASSGLFFMFQADYENAEKAALEALKLSQEIGNLWGQSYSQYVLSFLYYESLEVDRALEVMQNSVRLGEQAGFVVPLVDVYVIMGLLYAFLGDFERGLEFTRIAAQNAEKLLPAFQDGPVSAQALVHLLAGDFQAMEDVLNGVGISTDFSSTSAYLSVTAECYRLLAAKYYKEAYDLVDQFIAEAQARNILFFIGDAVTIKGRALLAQDHLEAARQTLQEARALTSFSRRTLTDLLPALREVETRLGNSAVAEHLIQEAQQVVQFILDHTSDPSLRSSFLARPEIRAILQEQP